MSAASTARVDPIHRDDVFVSRLAPGVASVPSSLVDLFLAHRRGKPWNETAACTSCKRKVITTRAAEALGRCGHCRSGNIVQIWDQPRAQAVLVQSMRETDGSGLTVAWGHVESPQPVLIGFVQMSMIAFKDISGYLGHDVLAEVVTLMGRHDFYAIIDNLVVADPQHDDVTALKLLDAAMRQVATKDALTPLVTLVESSSLYEAVLAQRRFRLCKRLPDRVLLMGGLT